MVLTRLLGSISGCCRIKRKELQGAIQSASTRDVPASVTLPESLADDACSRSSEHSCYLKDDSLSAVSETSITSIHGDDWSCSVAVPADATFAKANVATSATLGPPASIFADFGHFSDNTKEPETYTDRYGRTLFEI